MAGDTPVVGKRRPPKPAPAGRPQADTTVLTAAGTPAGMANRYAGGHLFLVLAGPSLNAYPEAAWYQRGVVTLAVNNAAAVVRPTLWTHVDRPENFHHAIWHDPGVTKVVPYGRMDRRLRAKRADGRIVDTRDTPRSLPNVLGYQRNAWFRPDRWLWEPTVNWGNSNDSAKKNGQPHVLNVMFAALRIAFYLGFANVYLCGCDWHMAPAAPYAFRQSKSAGAAHNNNGSYMKVGRMLAALKPHFDAAGFRVYNATPGSRLGVFPPVRFADAIAAATRGCGGPIDTEGWYGR